MNTLSAQECITQVALYTRVMKKHGYDRKNHKHGIGIVLDPKKYEPENRKEYEERTNGKNLSIKDLYKLYNIMLEHKKLKTIDGSDGISYDMIDVKHVDYPKRSPYDSRNVEIGRYDAINSMYSIDMDYLDSLSKEDDKENYIKQAFLNHYLFLGTAFDGNIYAKEVQDFLNIKPFFNFEVPESEEVGLSWPILDDYDEKGVIDDDDHLDIKKFLEVDDDTILLCMVSKENPDFPDYYEPEPDFIFPISRSYLKKLYNPINENGTYKEDFTSFAYRCAKDIEGIDDDLTFNVTMNQLYLLSPYFKITGGPQELYINTRDAMMMMYSKHKVFGLRMEKEIPITAGINVVNVGNSRNVFGEGVNVVSADHCQGGSNKPVYRVFMADIDEYTEVEREETKRKIITIEEVYEKYPDVKLIVESSEPKQQKILKVNRLELTSEYKTRVVQTIMQDQSQVMVLEPNESSTPFSFVPFYENIVNIYEHLERELTNDELDALDYELEFINNIDDLIEFLDTMFGLNESNERGLRQMLEDMVLETILSRARADGQIQRGINQDTTIDDFPNPPGVIDDNAPRIATNEVNYVIQDHYNRVEESQIIDEDDYEDATTVDQIIDILRSEYGLTMENQLRNRLDTLVNPPLARQLDFDDQDQDDLRLARQFYFDDEVEPQRNNSDGDRLARQLNFDDDEDEQPRRINAGDDRLARQLSDDRSDDDMMMEILEPPLPSDDDYDEDLVN